MSEYDYDLTTWAHVGGEGPMHTRARWRTIMRLAQTASPSGQRLRRLYVEVYGAEPGRDIPVERLRESIVEACDEVLERSAPA